MDIQGYECDSWPNSEDCEITYIDCLHIKKISKSKEIEESSTQNEKNEQETPMDYEKQLEELSRKLHIREMLARSLKLNI
nr:DNA replication licensing factor MCM4 [Tanacetum cinerariifolium]